MALSLSKKLARIQRHPAVSKCYRDSDGWWIELKSGWKNTLDEPIGALHGAHEDTLEDVYARLDYFFSCDCAECKQLIERDKAKDKK